MSGVASPAPCAKVRPQPNNSLQTFYELTGMLGLRRLSVGAEVAEEGVSVAVGAGWETTAFGRHSGKRLARGPTETIRCLLLLVEDHVANVQAPSEIGDGSAVRHR